MARALIAGTGALVILVAIAVVVALWLTDGRRGQRPASNHRAAPQRPQSAAGRVNLPPGEAGHVAAAEALHRATGIYLAECQARVTGVAPGGRVMARVHDAVAAHPATVAWVVLVAVAALIAAVVPPAGPWLMVGVVVAQTAVAGR